MIQADKPILYLTDNVKAVARWLYPHATSFKHVGISRAEGILKTGQAVYIVHAMDPGFVQIAIEGREFASYEVVGDIHPKAVELAKVRVR